MFKFSESLLKTAAEAENRCSAQFAAIDATARYNGEKVLNAFTEIGVSETHLKGTTGYGYDDAGRDVTDKVFARVLNKQDALVRHTFVNGTHAIATALFAVLRGGDTLLSLSGGLYDTLDNVLTALKEQGVKYEQIECCENICDYADLVRGCKAAYIQRSRGYSLRDSLTVSRIDEMCGTVRKLNPKAVIITDNCYGELTELCEPDADLIIGSLIKNLGGGIAETGGYIAGNADLIKLCADRLTVPGMGKEIGCTIGDVNKNMLKGLFFAPEVVAGALKTSVFACSLFDLLGYKTYPKYDDKRTDIIAAIALGDSDKLKRFCRAVQAASPVDSGAIPTPWEMPGYAHKVIMAAGAFTMGSSIEISADAPLRDPYAVWLQGGLTYATGRIAVLNAATAIE